MIVFAFSLMYFLCFQHYFINQSNIYIASSSLSILLFNTFTFLLSKFIIPYFVYLLVFGLDFLQFQMFLFAFNMILFCYLCNYSLSLFFPYLSVKLLLKLQNLTKQYLSNIIILMNQQVHYQVLAIFQQQYYQKYKRKLTHNQSYILASFGLIDLLDNIKIISIGFGTKSIPYTISQQHRFKLVKDMHAQILAKRGFRKWIINNIPNQKYQNQYFQWDNKRNKHSFQTNKFKIFFYSSEIFCGDCMVNQKLGLFTGAKPLTQFNQTYGKDQYQKCILRTKPGRIDLPNCKRSLSLSCSDKIGLWNILGIQGKHLFNIVTPIYIDIIFIVSPAKYLETIQNGISLTNRLSYLKNTSEETILRQIFNIKINGLERKISYQFRQNKPKISIITVDKLCSNKETIDICGIIMDQKTQWLVGKTGLREGSSLENLQKKGGMSEYCSKRLYENIVMNPKHFQYKAIKQRIKYLFKIWTDDFKVRQVMQKQKQKYQLQQKQETHLKN